MKDGCCSITLGKVDASSRHKWMLFLHKMVDMIRYQGKMFALPSHWETWMFLLYTMVVVMRAHFLEPLYSRSKWFAYFFDPSPREDSSLLALLVDNNNFVPFSFLDLWCKIECNAIILIHPQQFTLKLRKDQFLTQTRLEGRRLFTFQS